MKLIPPAKERKQETVFYLNAFQISTVHKYRVFACLLLRSIDGVNGAITRSRRSLLCFVCMLSNKLQLSFVIEENRKTKEKHII